MYTVQLYTVQLYAVQLYTVVVVYECEGNGGGGEEDGVGEGGVSECRMYIDDAYTSFLRIVG